MGGKENECPEKETIRQYTNTVPFERRKGESILETNWVGMRLG